MSTYTKVTRHPQSGKYEIATWHDDYFGPHIYGVEFESDGKVYPTDVVNTHQLKEFWVADVVKGFELFMIERVTGNRGHADDQRMFLNYINDEYRERWKRDPAKGEGAIS